VSGIVAMINLDGAPVDGLLLRRMTDFLDFRGPDARAIWSAGPVGFGHAMLRTTWESDGEQQPGTLNRLVWITADARVDGRAELIRKLPATGRILPRGASDVELLLHSYHTWAERCVEHLLGDFAFAIWDGPRRRLFCARDHLGAKPLFYSHRPNVLLLSNTLKCLRLHPDVPGSLNELAIGDFLLFGSNQELSTTSFEGIRRLPPAHTLSWSSAGLRMGRYWELTERPTIRHGRSRDYIEQFQILLDEAVDDRLRTDRVGICMSGGLDSPAIAATAQRLRARGRAPVELRAYTVVYDRLIPDLERHFSGRVAAWLRLPIEYLAADDFRPFERWDSAVLRRPEPTCDPLAVVSVEQSRMAAAFTRVLLCGYDGDAALDTTLRSHFAGLLGAGKLARLAAELAWYLGSQHALPQVGFRAWLGRRLGGTRRVAPGPPRWLNPSFSRRLDLEARWEQFHAWHARDWTSPRAVAYQMFRWVNIPFILERDDGGVTGFPIEVRNPLLDIRLLDFFLALPPIPWCVKKHLFRVAMRDRLPPEVCRRPKSPLGGDPVLQCLRQPGGRVRAVEDLDPAPELASFVNIEELKRALGSTGGLSRWWTDIRPCCLNHWLTFARPL
jgi:asparagine synthase (glutamine-hydrolysing)